MTNETLSVTFESCRKRETDAAAALDRNLLTHAAITVLTRDISQRGNEWSESRSINETINRNIADTNLLSHACGPNVRIGANEVN